MSQAEQPLEATGGAVERRRREPEPFAPSRAEAPPAPLATSHGSVGSKRGSWSGSRAVEATGPRLQLGLGSLGWAESFFLGCRPARLDRGSGLGFVQLNRNFWVGLRFGPL